MKRFISITIIILIVVAIILTGAWFFSRRTAEKNGTAKPTFRQFLSGDTDTGTGLTPNDGSLSSVFVDDNLSSATPGASVTPTIGTQVAQFSSGAYTPTTTSEGTATNGSNSSGNTPGSGVPGEVTAPGSTTVDPTTQTPASVPPTIAGPECSEADLNIAFSSSDLARLQALQNRFYALSQALRTDADVATETGNHDNFKAKVDKVTALYTSCVQYSQAIPTNSPYSVRIPTPFWHADPHFGQESEVFIGPAGPYDGAIGGSGTWNGSSNGATPTMPTNTPLGLRSLQRSLRLNLW